MSIECSEFKTSFTYITRRRTKDVGRGRKGVEN